MNYKGFALLIGLLATATLAQADNMENTIYQFKVNDIDGKQVDLSVYKGKVLLIVNVASKCGYTPQYEALQTLYSKNSEKGFEILGFPANDFLWQEPGTNKEIKEFCSMKFHVTFPMFEKIKVKGKGIHPLYKYLTEESGFKGKITWNFNKFLVDRQGKVIARFDSKVKPDSPEIAEALEKALNQKP